MLRNQLLESWGWRVVTVPYYEWWGGANGGTDIPFFFVTSLPDNSFFVTPPQPQKRSLLELRLFQHTRRD